ncbi:recombinase family protein [Palleronia abyssalis]|uniref:DNA-invertase hin n=1 Tax=Palleronia abyssalis TaxID=1501240 RepID=A0A2R8BY04_9RHOB|nr:recombinase family protein [Palleronia abyssalis]SPJ25045.1 DNA-invertase hin [Palleronia abyssalis]
MSRSTIRCAIYTRKSSEEGLDQGFNSLDAQHEACAAYVASQRHEGWTLGSERYDDGGLSGGTLERPALQRLLADIEAGRIGMVVVYKIDRLTRSLADFARLVERLETAGCSFVSVTQAFNTSSSMGRLTLNVLLSFAQFEREVTAERIRDKIAASKQKGLWMGGTVPLGYDAHPDPNIRELVVNEREAETVRSLFDLYDRHGCLRQVADAAAGLGLRSRHRTSASGRSSGGGPLSRGQIHYLLTNPVYRGRIRHKEKVWPGRHPPVIPEDLWDRVQARLQAVGARPRGRRDARPAGTAAIGSLLTGKFRDETGDRLTPTHTTRRGKRLRYYVSNRLLAGTADPAGWRLPAPALDQTIGKIVPDHLQSCAARHALLARPDAVTAEQVKASAAVLIGKLRSGAGETLRDLVAAGTLRPGSIVLSLDAPRLAAALSVEPDDLCPALLGIEAPLALRRRGVEVKLMAGRPAPAPDPGLVRILAEAHSWTAALRKGEQLSDLAARTGHSDSYIRTRAQLAFLSPKIQAAILAGTQPPELTVNRMIRAPLPLDWSEQARRFGIS